jgi:hypothetical protein
MAKVEFREGFREVPDHVADMMRGLETWRYSYEQATRLSENRMTSDYLNRVQRDVVRDALRRTR